MDGPEEVIRHGQSSRSVVILCLAGPGNTSQGALVDMSMDLRKNVPDSGGCRSQERWESRRESRRGCQCDDQRYGWSRVSYVGKGWEPTHSLRSLRL